MFSGRTSAHAVQVSQAALALFKFGQAEAAKRGLILVDTKYEFGKDAEGNIMLIDEIHTPDSSRCSLAPCALHAYDAASCVTQTYPSVVRWRCQGPFRSCLLTAVSKSTHSPLVEFACPSAGQHSSVCDPAHPQL